MPRTRSQRTPRALNDRTGLQTGRSGACEALLYQFTGRANGEGESPVERVAARSLHEAMIYMRKFHADVDILRVEFVALIEIVSGSPLD